MRRLKRPTTLALALGGILTLSMSGTALSVHSGWHTDQTLTWYGAGLYGQRTACGQKLTKPTKHHAGLEGVANRTLPCGTWVEIRWNGKTVIAPVVDRGPYPSSDRKHRKLDLTAQTMKELGGYYTKYHAKWRAVYPQSAGLP